MWQGFLMYFVQWLFNVKCKNLGAEIKVRCSFLLAEYCFIPTTDISIIWGFTIRWLYWQKWKLQGSANSDKIENMSQLLSKFWIFINGKKKIIIIKKATILTLFLLLFLILMFTLFFFFSPSSPHTHRKRKRVKEPEDS